MRRVVRFASAPIPERRCPCDGCRPSRSPQRTGAAVTAIRSFRGMAWYESGARPWFLADDSTFHDVGEPVEHDVGAWHGLARDDGGHLTGCVRVTPVDQAASSPALAALDANTLDGVLSRIGHPATGQGGELGKLVVHPAHRGGPTASLLVALSLAVGRALHRSRAWGFVATGRGQHRFLAHYGCHDLGHLREYPLYGEETRLMWCDLTTPAGRFEPLVSELAGRISINEPSRGPMPAVTEHNHLEREA